MDISCGVKAKALALRESPPAGVVMEIERALAEIELPMERPLFAPAVRPVIAEVALKAGDADLVPLRSRGMFSSRVSSSVVIRLRLLPLRWFSLPPGFSLRRSRSSFGA